MKRSLWIVLLVALILALTIPLTLNLYQSEQAFTSDNLIVINTAISCQ